MNKYELKRIKNPETHAYGDVVVIEDENGLACDVGFKDQNTAFDYLKINLEEDAKYKNYMLNTSCYIKEIYNELCQMDEEKLQKILFNMYRRKCMDEYFK